MFLGEALPSHGQDQQAEEGVREVPTDHGQDKQDP